MIPYGRQEICQSDIDAVVDVLRSNWLTQGPMVGRFEQAVIAHTGVAHAVAVNSATSALHIAFMALDVEPGDRVWTVPNTFVATSNAALYCGAQVDFVDIDPRTYNMSVDCLAEKLQHAKKANKLPKVVVPVHYAGQPCDMPAIHRLSEEFGFQIVEDAAHAVGASYENVKVGSCTHSQIVIFSFHPVKIITTAEGGMALTNDAHLAERMARHRSHGITTKRELMASRPDDEIWNYQQIDLGYNYRMTDIQAALGISQMERLDMYVQRRQTLAHHYDVALADMSVITPWQRASYSSARHLYPIRIRASLCGKTQREVYDSLRHAGIGANVHYIPVYRQPYYERMGFESGYCPEAELYHKEAISLPAYPTLQEGDQMYVVDSIRSALRI